MGEGNKRKPVQARAYRAQFIKSFLLRVPVESEAEHKQILKLSPEERRARLLGEGKENDKR